MKRLIFIAEAKITDAEFRRFVREGRKLTNPGVVAHFQGTGKPRPVAFIGGGVYEEMTLETQTRIDFLCSRKGKP